MPKRARMYSGKRVWKDVEKGMRRSWQFRRTERPSVPSVEMWMRSGRKSSMISPTFGRVNMASRISG